jgi:hypothetical protein
MNRKTAQNGKSKKWKLWGGLRLLSTLLRLPGLLRLTAYYALSYTLVYRETRSAPNTVHCIRRRTDGLGSARYSVAFRGRPKPQEGTTRLRRLAMNTH